jgi:hypothetical protein
LTYLWKLLNRIDVPIKLLNCIDVLTEAAQLHWCALELEWNLTGAEHGSIASRCCRSWVFRIKINRRFCVLCFQFSCVFLDLIQHTPNQGYKWDHFIYFLLDVWVWFPSLRALLLENIVAVAVLMFEAAYAFLMPCRIGIGIGIGVAL